MINKPIVFFDLETTGVDPVVDRIVEFAAVKIESLDKPHKREIMHFYINPIIEIPKEAIAIHGITNERIKNAHKFKDLSNDIFNFIKDCDLAGFNIINFDIPLLLREFQRVGIHISLKSINIIDSCDIFHKKEKRDLAGALKFYCGKSVENLHSAIVDCESTIDVLIKQIERYDLTKDASEIMMESRNTADIGLTGKMKYDAADNIVLTFGKHKGVPIQNISSDYIDWLWNNSVMGIDGYIFDEIMKEISK